MKLQEKDFLELLKWDIRFQEETKQINSERAEIRRNKIQSYWTTVANYYAKQKKLREAEERLKKVLIG